MSTVAFAVLALTLPAAAQRPSTAYVVYNDVFPCQPSPTPECYVSRVLRATIDGPAARVDWVREVPKLFDIKEAYVTPDGGTLVWLAISLATGPGVFIHDVTTGQTQLVATLHGAQFLVGNPRRAEVYVADGTGVTALSRAGVRRFPEVACRPSDFNHPSISADGSRLSYLCIEGPGLPKQVAVFNTTNGVLVGKTEGDSGMLSPDGTELYVGGYIVAGQFRMQRRSVATGVVLTDAPGLGGVIAVEAASGDVLIATPSVYFRADPVTLAPRWSAPLLQGTGDSDWPVLDQATSLLYTSPSSAFGIHDTTTGQLVLQAELRGRQEGARGVALAVGPPRPVAPAGLTSAVQGSRVTLAWATGSAEDTSRYVVEAGSASGLANLATFDVGLQSALVVDAVPPGTYYVRVRASNYTGPSAPSNEVVVTVP